MSQNDLSIAGKSDFTSPGIFLLFAGDAPVSTQPDTIATDAVIIPQFTPLTRDATSNKLRRATVTAGVPEKVVAITTYAVDATGGDVYKSNYTGGYFNTDAIAWPAAFTTELLKQAAVSGSPIHIRRITA